MSKDTPPFREEGKSLHLVVNGRKFSLPRRKIEPRLLLVYFLRDKLNLTGTHVGCDTGHCGACTVIMNGSSIKSCMVLALQADHSSIMTVEGLAKSEDELDPIQDAFWENHGLQCGYCTPGMLMSARFLLSRSSNPSEEEIRRALEGNLCMCTGYENIIGSIKQAALKMTGSKEELT